MGVGPPTMLILELKLRLPGYLLGPPTDPARVSEHVSTLLPDAADRSLFQIIITTGYYYLFMHLWKSTFLLCVPCPCDTLCSSDSLLFLRV